MFFLFLEEEAVDEEEATESASLSLPLLLVLPLISLRSREESWEPEERLRFDGGSKLDEEALAMMSDVLAARR